MQYETIVPIGSVIDAVDMHGVRPEPFVPFAVRGPQFVETRDGTIIFIFEAKYHSQADEEPACKVLLRSHDGGRTWGEARMLKYDDIVIGGIPIYDEINDTLIYFARTREWKNGCEEDRLLNEQDQVDGKVLERFWVAKSPDNGLTWSDYREVFIDAPEEWRVKHCPTPGIGLQLKHQKDSARNGRLVIPANHIGSNEGGRNDFGAHVLVSDDFGESWRIGAVQAYVGGNECTMTELSDGTLILNCRTQASIPANKRLQSFSFDGCDSLVDHGPVETLFDPCCHGGFDSAVVGGREYVFFTAPSGELDPPFSCLGIMGRWGRREMMTLHVSCDGGRSYQPIAVLSPKDEMAAYSALYATKAGRLLCAWESGPEIGLYRDIKYMSFDLKELVKRIEE